MFDIGFQELVLLGVIALIVVGPERLPKMARTLGLWSGKLRYYVNQVKNDIDREVRAQELKELLDKPAAELKELSSVAKEAKGALDEAKATIETIPKDISTPNEPAAGSIFPTGLPDPGPEPARGEANEAQSGSTPEPARMETSATPSGGTHQPARTETNTPQSGETPEPARMETSATPSGGTHQPARTETNTPQSGETPEPARTETSGT